MGSIFDVPSGLLFVLSLVTSNPSDVATAATGLAAPKSATVLNLEAAPCRHGEQAWFAALKHGAGGVAFSGLAGRIFKTKGGRYYVPVAQDRDEIVKLQHDNAVSCFIALSSAANSARRLNLELGHHATLTDLYVAHVFGVDYAVRILKAAKATPGKRMAALFPSLDTIEPHLYAGRNNRMTIGGFVKRLQQVVRHEVDRAHGPPRHLATPRTRRKVSKKVAATQRLNALVKKASLSARAALQRGPRLTRVAPTRRPNTAPRTLYRLSLGSGIGKTVHRAARRANQSAIAF